MTIFPVLPQFSQCKKIKLTKFPVFSLPGKVNIQIPCFPCAVATLYKLHARTISATRLVYIVVHDTIHIFTPRRKRKAVSLDNLARLDSVPNLAATNMRYRS